MVSGHTFATKCLYMTDPFITFLASFLIWFIFLAILVIWLFDGRIRKEQVLHAVFAATAAWLVTALIKEFFPSPRPFTLNAELLPKTLTLPSDSAFPSTHSAVAFALAATIYLHTKKVGSVFLFAAFLVAMGRILANVHYPVDTIGGAFFGVIIAWVVRRTHMFGMLPTRKQLKTKY